MESPTRYSGLLLVLLTASCSSFTYDLTDVAFPVSARPAVAKDAVGESFELGGKTVLWLHGLAGSSQPDVAAMLQEHCGDCDGVVNFRAGASTSFHDWLVTHLTLGLVRMKTVSVTGQRLTHGDS